MSQGPRRVCPAQSKIYTVNEEVVWLRAPGEAERSAVLYMCCKLYFKLARYCGSKYGSHHNSRETVEIFNKLGLAEAQEDYTYLLGSLA